MRSAATLICSVLACLSVTSGPVEAQEDPPRIGPFAVDIRGTFPNLPNEPQLAESRGLDLAELPGRALGVDAAAHLYLFSWKAVTFGLGGQLTVSRATLTPPAGSGLRAVNERFISIAPHVSFNFGTGDGWSYISGGLGMSTWRIAPEGQGPGGPDRERLATFNYGGGARWFARPHLAFTFDVRFHAIAAGTPQLDRPGSPRTTLLVMGAGISVK